MLLIHSTRFVGGIDKNKRPIRNSQVPRTPRKRQRERERERQRNAVRWNLLRPEKRIHWEIRQRGIGMGKRGERSRDPREVVESLAQRDASRKSKAGAVKGARLRNKRWFRWRISAATRAGRASAYYAPVLLFPRAKRRGEGEEADGTARLKRTSVGRPEEPAGLSRVVRRGPRRPRSWNWRRAITRTGLDSESSASLIKTRRERERVKATAVVNAGRCDDPAGWQSDESDDRPNRPMTICLIGEIWNADTAILSRVLIPSYD